MAATQRCGTVGGHGDGEVTLRCKRLAGWGWTHPPALTTSSADTRRPRPRPPRRKAT
ncbi:hypothetical protein [Corynebacterium matruchotii]|uniref:hypothetical protein n=1 Tax=Corynebacterium matruchotii TaxID=43768 RepID=UPI00242B8DE1|nr:hypothetical protein [Corynebacterium matruchotii]